MHALRIPPPDESGELVRTRFVNFLQQYVGSDPVENLTIQQRLMCNYDFQIKKMIETYNNTVFVDFNHLRGFDYELAEAIELEYYRFDRHLRIAVRDVVIALGFQTYVLDIDKGQREFFVAFYNMDRIERIRSMKTDRVGRLVSVVGTVTRSSEVRPELLFASFQCLKCNTLHAAIEQQFQFTEPQICRSHLCGGTKFQIILDQCVFVDWQRLRVQENADEIPPGSMPRCVDIICHNSSVEVAKAGDKVIFTGMLAVVPDTSGLSRAGEAAVGGGKGGETMGDGVRGLKSLGVKELTYKLLFMACSVQQMEMRGGPSGASNIIMNSFFSKLLNSTSGNNVNEHEGSADVLLDLTDSQKAEIIRMRNSPHLYSRMVESVCPTVFGHSEIKRGVLLQLFGGVHKKTPEGTSLRGDINVCIVGDPSCAKSQFLKYVYGFLPRAIYTSGKSSSAAGLTASVNKDPETGEFCVEAGALMLADNSICCIDEFDKMDAMDQVAIHEAMEQQTISITKAGVVATLNARTSILAAANPVFGRYDRGKTLKANVAISAPIMSRFDLFFIILDEGNPTLDESIARHIVAVHQGEERKKILKDNVPFTREQLQRYIRFAKCINPRITNESRKVFVECYRLLRQNDIMGKNKTAYRITVRQLESLIRLSEGLARLHLDRLIQPAYVREAYRLLQKSIIFVETEDIELDGNEEEMDRIIMMEKEEVRKRRIAAGLEVEDEVPEAAKRQRFQEPAVHVGSADVDVAAAQEVHDGGDVGVSNIHQAQDPVAVAPVVKKKEKTKITADEYRSVSNLVVLYVKRKEEEQQMETEGSSSVLGVKYADIIQWYLNEHVDELQTEELYEQKRRLIHQIIRRMIKTDGVLMEVGDYPEGTLSEEKYLCRHPSTVE